MLKATITFSIIDNLCKLTINIVKSKYNDHLDVMEVLYRSEQLC